MVRGRGHADLLAEHGAHRDLEAVHRAGHAQSGSGGDQRRQCRVAGQDRVDLRRVGVQVEEVAAAADGYRDVAQVVHHQPRVDHALSSRSSTWPVPCGRRSARR